MNPTTPNTTQDSGLQGFRGLPSAKEKTITINGTTYNLSQLSEASRQHLRNIRLADEEAARAQVLVSALQIARNSYAQMLLAELQKVEVQTPPTAAEEPKAG